ncbi:MAG: PQQ-binding-like beta-propeller repeat protein [Candidatus Latescibacter sp.]|nr:PQQ-binding-like beta-propeller repeat protein [Candidatus Latescibacter sp.]
MAQIRWKAAILTVAICIAASWSGCIFAAESNGFSFVNISDVHIPAYGFAIGQPLDETSLMQMQNPQRLQQLVGECLAMEPKPAFVINSGDTGDAGWTPLLKLYQKLMQPLVLAGIPVYTVVGNHDLDYAGIGAQDLGEIFDPLGPALIGRHGTRYSFDYGGCHFIFLNIRPISGLIRLTPTDIAWLSNDLRAVKKDRRILLFMHANVPEEDTSHIVELLQPFKYPVIFQGHTHNDAITKWGGVPVVVTGSLYGGTPKAGSYRVVTVQPDRILVRTRDFARPASTYEPKQAVEFPQSGPRLKVMAPKSDAPVSGNLIVTAGTEPAFPGAMEYSIPGFTKWTPMTGGNGMWKASAPLPVTPGRYLLTIRFTGENGAIVLAHTIFKVQGEKVREIWTRDLGSAILGAPVIWENLVIVPTIEGGVYALRLDNGKEVWRRKAEQEQILGRIVTDGVRVYYGAGRTVYACDAKTGKPLWRTPVNGAIVAGLTLDNGKLFVPAGEHKLVCLDTQKGKILWDYTVGLPIIMEPAAEGNRVFFGAMDGYFRALDAETGKEIWKNQVSSPEDNYTTAPFWPPVIARGKVLVSKIPAQKDEKNLIAFNASNGKVVWSLRSTGSPYRQAVNPKKDVFYTTSAQNGRRGLQCLSPEDGSPLSFLETGVGMSAGIASGNTLIIRDDDKVCCVEASSGKVQWTYRASTGPQGSYYGPGAFAVRDNLVIAGTMDGRVIALQW